jgi:hypothetical protein
MLPATSGIEGAGIREPHRQIALPGPPVAAAASAGLKTAVRVPSSPYIELRGRTFGRIIGEPANNNVAVYSPEPVLVALGRS